MPTFNDPLADAADASEALRGLAHASRTFDNPADTYAVFGDVISRCGRCDRSSISSRTLI